MGFFRNRVLVGNSRQISTTIAYPPTTKSLLHFDGIDGSTGFNDELGKLWTPYVTAQVDTAQSKFGGASLLLDGNSDYLLTPDHADFNIAASNFCIECWVKKNGDGAREVITAQCNSSGSTTSLSFLLEIQADNTVRGIIASGANMYSAISTGTITGTAWHHVALVRNGNTLYVYIDGTNDGTKDVTGITANDSANKVGIGCAGEYVAALLWNGWIDEYRVTNGEAIYTANFTPSPVAFVPIAQY